MRALVVCLALFLALAVLHCDAKRKKRSGEDKQGDCSYNGTRIGEGRTKRLEVPCEKVACIGGKVNVKTCEMRRQERRKRSTELRNKDDEEDKKDEEENDDAEEDEDTEEKKKNALEEKKNKNVFPRCCKTQG